MVMSDNVTKIVIKSVECAAFVSTVYVVGKFGLTLRLDIAGKPAITIGKGDGLSGGKIIANIFGKFSEQDDDKVRQFTNNGTKSKREGYSEGA